jgi:biopolymer transport protein ExbD
MYHVPSSRRRKKKEAPLNLLPIMDVVFILIFFLLTSAHFLKVFEIGSDLPVFKLATTDIIEKNEFELKAKIGKGSLILFNGVNQESIETFNLNEEFEERLKRVLLELKTKYPEKSRVVLIPDLNIPYDKLVSIMDLFRSDYINNAKKILFNQIMFESDDS